MAETAESMNRATTRPMFKLHVRRNGALLSVNVSYFDYHIVPDRLYCELPPAPGNDEEKQRELLIMLMSFTTASQVGPDSFLIPFDSFEITRV